MRRKTICIKVVFTSFLGNSVIWLLMFIVLNGYSYVTFESFAQMITELKIKHTVLENRPLLFKRTYNNHGQKYEFRVRTKEDESLTFFVREEEYEGYSINDTLLIRYYLTSDSSLCFKSYDVLGKKKKE